MRVGAVPVVVPLTKVYAPAPGCAPNVLVRNVLDPDTFAVEPAEILTLSWLAPLKSNSRIDVDWKLTLLLNVAVPRAPERPGREVPSKLMVGVEAPEPATLMALPEKTSEAPSPRLVVANPVIDTLPPLLSTFPLKLAVELPAGPDTEMFEPAFKLPNRVVPALVAVSAMVLVDPVAVAFTGPPVVSSSTGEPVEPTLPAVPTKTLEPLGAQAHVDAAEPVMLGALSASDAVDRVVPTSVPRAEMAPSETAVELVTAKRPGASPRSEANSFAALVKTTLPSVRKYPSFA